MKINKLRREDEIKRKLLDFLVDYYNTPNSFRRLCLGLSVPVSNIVDNESSTIVWIERLFSHFNREYGSVIRIAQYIVETHPNNPAARELDDVIRQIAIDQDHEPVRPPLNDNDSGFRAILVSDIEGSTNKLNIKSEKDFLDLIKKHNVIFRERIPKYDGKEIRHTGDGFVISFKSPISSVLFALDVQLGFVLWNVKNTREHNKIRVRIGIDYGEVNISEGQPEGKPAVVATRILSHARGEEIIVSEKIQSITRGDLDINYLDIGLCSLKGFQDTYRLHKIDWRSCLISGERDL